MLLVAMLLLLISWRIHKLPSKDFDSINRYHWALASGALGFFILIAPIQEFDQARADNTSGMALVGLVTLIFLIWGGRRLKKEVPPNYPSSQITSPGTPFELDKGAN
jgi:hypothetical protein